MTHGDAHGFGLRLLSWDEVHELPGDWPEASLRELLQRMEIEGVSDSELEEMCLMGLQDRERDEAADLVLELVFGETMRRGVRQNLIEDLRDDRPWEDFAELRHQPGIFRAITLLQKAFPKDYGKPDIGRIELEITPQDATGLRWLSGEIDPALLLRLLAGGMEDRAILRRLFGEALAGDHFPEAEAILWRVEAASDPGASPIRLILHSSLQWFAPLEDADAWTAKGWKDAPPSEDDED